MISSAIGRRIGAPRRTWRGALFVAGILAFLLSIPDAAIAAEPAAPAVASTNPDSAAAILTIDGLVKHPLQLTADAVRKLPSLQVEVSYQGEHGAERASFTGAALWALIEEAGGIDDPAKGAVLRHTITVTARDGYAVVISTGEIAPEFGGKAAMVAYGRDGKALDKDGLRLVMPGDKRGGRYVRDVVKIDVK